MPRESTNIYGTTRTRVHIKFNTEMPDYSRFAVEQPDWGHVYHPSCKEDIQVGIPVDKKGKPVMTTTFVDANDIITGISCTGIIHLLNKTPIDWLSTEHRGDSDVWVRNCGRSHSSGSGCRSTPHVEVSGRTIYRAIMVI